MMNKIRKIFTVVLCVVLCLIVAVPSMAQVETHFTANTGNWDSSGNWSAGVPDADDHAVIDSGKTCTFNVASAEIDQLTVQSTGVLNIQTGNVLELDGGQDESTIDGTINLEGSGSWLLMSGQSQALIKSGATPGSIVGMHNSALIAISGSFTITNQVTIEGKLTIAGAAFINEGTVKANRSGTLLIDVGAVEDTADALWVVDTAVDAAGDAELHFDVDAGGGIEHDLEGDFDIEDGVLENDGDSICTTGMLTLRLGDIDCLGGQIRFKLSCG